MNQKDPKFDLDTQTQEHHSRAATTKIFNQNTMKFELVLISKQVCEVNQ